MTSGRQVLGLAQGYLAPLQRARVDTVVLGCTHYPLLAGRAADRAGRRTSRSSPAPRRPRKDVVRVLMARDLAPRARGARRHAPHEFLATGDPEPFRRLGAGSSVPEIGTVPRWHAAAAREPLHSSV